MSPFAKNLRSLRKEANMRQQDLADKLGVAQTTIASYEQGQRFPNHETLIEIADFFNVSIDFLLGREENNKFDMSKVKKDIKSKILLNDLAEKYFNALLSGEKQKSDRIVYKAIENDWSLQDVYLKILQPVLFNIGILWETNRIDVFQEHFMTNNIYTVLDKLKDRVEKVNMHNGSKKDKNILLLSVSGEQHQIGLRMINNLLEIKGWKTFYLGVNIPSRSVINAIKSYKADLIMISVTLHEHLNHARNLIQTIKNNVETRDVKIMVGGAAFRKFSWEDVGADAYAIDAESAVQKTEELIGK